MFQFLRKEKDLNIYAPVKGKCFDISECSDKVFSNKLMGDGFMIDPEDNVVCSPCDGIVSMVFPTCHAFGITAADGTKILIHIGLDTVNLNGEGFQQKVSVNEKVKKNTPLVACDFEMMENRGIDTKVMVIVTDTKEIEKKHMNDIVDTDDIIVERRS